jgi:endonuclease/exonuclease/phosphatase family metal-dependent hydrolase
LLARTESAIAEISDVNRRRAVLAEGGRTAAARLAVYHEPAWLAPCCERCWLEVGVFRVMTWNVENLFRPGAPAAPSTEQAYEAKLAGLAALISAQDPDVISLQEIGDPDALSDLIDAVGGSWHRRVSAHPDARGIRVAWLTKPQITASTDVVDFPPALPAVTADDSGTTLQQMGRGAVAITITAPDGQPLRLLTTHLKSKLLTFPGGRFQPHDEDERARYASYALDRRAAEAVTVRSWATAALDQQPGVRLIVTGDLNDTVQAATSQILLGPPGSEIGTAGFDRPDQGDTQRMWNLAPLMPAGQDYSRINQGRHELIDHILVSAGLVQPADAIQIQAITDQQPLPSISTDPTARRNAPTSDHAPVVATFTTL